MAIVKLMRRILNWFDAVPEEEVDEFCRAVHKGDKDRVEAMLNTNPKLIAGRDELGRLGVHYAAWRGHKDVMELLLDRGSDVNAKTDRGHTPLHLAVHQNHKELAELLIARGADVNARTRHGRTPLSSAHRQAAEVLRKHGATE